MKHTLSHLTHTHTTHTHRQTYTLHTHAHTHTQYFLWMVWFHHTIQYEVWFTGRVKYSCDMCFSEACECVREREGERVCMLACSRCTIIEVCFCNFVLAGESQWLVSFRFHLVTQSFPLSVSLPRLPKGCAINQIFSFLWLVFCFKYSSTLVLYRGALFLELQTYSQPG